jgi:hypothetical protein
VRLSRDAVGLRTFLPLNDFEGHFVTFFQAFITFLLDRAEMHEDVGASVIPQETVAFYIVEPLYSAFVQGHKKSSLEEMVVMQPLRNGRNNEGAHSHNHSNHVDVCALLHGFFSDAVVIGIGSLRCRLKEPTKSAKACQTSNGNENGTEICGHVTPLLVLPDRINLATPLHSNRVNWFCRSGQIATQLFYRHSGRHRRSVSKKIESA